MLLPASVALTKELVIDSVQRTTLSFYPGLALAVAVYIAFLTTADFWGT